MKRLIVLTSVLALAAGAGGIAGFIAADRLFDQRSPGGLIRYVERRLQGHPRLETMALPLLAWWRTQVERPVDPTAALPALGRGPRALAATDAPKTIGSVEELRSAIARAQPGDVLQLLPGTYRLETKLHPVTAGRPDAPITLRGGPGVRIDSAVIEAIKIGQPHWIFEGLHLRGVCRQDHDCEHALHVVGGAVGTVIRDNHLEDFNAALKVNGEGGRFPDRGRLEHNDIINRAPRLTERPVSPVDIVAASGWVVTGNRVANFVKGGSNGVSYGIFMKGGGRDGRIEGNLVVCTPEDVSQIGIRVGISLGGGTTGRGACRDPECIVEHEGGIVANNIVAHCNDAGIDVNRATRGEVRHNTLINTAGILLRDDPSSARVRANLLDGRLRVRPPAAAMPVDNVTGDIRDWIAGADALDLRWSRRPDAVASADENRDFCGRERGPFSLPGALAGDPC